MFSVDEGSYSRTTTSYEISWFSTKPKPTIYRKLLHSHMCFVPLYPAYCATKNSQDLIIFFNNHDNTILLPLFIFNVTQNNKVFLTVILYIYHGNPNQVIQWILQYEYVICHYPLFSRRMSTSGLLALGDTVGSTRYVYNQSKKPVKLVCPFYCTEPEGSNCLLYNHAGTVFWLCRSVVV